MARIDKSELNEDDKKLTNEQTYDSALAAMVSKLRQFIVPLVNEAFGEKFTQSTNVTLLNNKHVIRRTDDSLDRRDSDIVIELKEIIEGWSKRFTRLSARPGMVKRLSFALLNTAHLLLSKPLKLLMRV